MKTFWALGAALVVAAATPAMAVNNACSADDAICVNTEADSNSAAPLDPIGENSPINAIVAAGGEGDPANDGYLFIDGAGSNAAVSEELAGYLGIHASGDGGPLFGSASDAKFNRNGRNNTPLADALGGGGLPELPVPAPALPVSLP